MSVLIYCWPIWVFWSNVVSSGMFFNFPFNSYYYLYKFSSYYLLLLPFFFTDSSDLFCKRLIFCLLSSCYFYFFILASFSACYLICSLCLWTRCSSRISSSSIFYFSSSFYRFFSSIYAFNYDYKSIFYLYCF